MQDKLSRRFQPCGHICQPESYCLMLNDGAPETFALLRIGNRNIECCLSHTDALRGNSHSSCFEIRQGDSIPGAFFAKSQIVLDKNTVETNRACVGCALTQLVFNLVDLIAIPVCRHQEAAYPTLTHLRIGDGKYYGNASNLSRRYELLAAIENVPALYSLRFCSNSCGI